jgi:hypothetical protein
MRNCLYGIRGGKGPAKTRFARVGGPFKERPFPASVGLFLNQFY